MKVKIEITSAYGFDKNWTLICKSEKGNNEFFLGQDIKFCNRVLGIEPKEIISQIGSANISEPSTNQKLAKFIVSELGITEDNVAELNSWDFHQIH